MIKRVAIVVLLGIVLFSCKKEVINNPEKSVLLLPSNNNACVPVLTTNDTADVLLTWQQANFTESYTVVIQSQADSSEKTATTTTTSVVLTLNRGEAFSWWVVSSSETTAVTAKSDVWNFYVERKEQDTFIPFQASLVSPINNSTQSLVGNAVTLSWTASDLDNDIVDYDVYVGESENSLSLQQANVTTTSYSLTATLNKQYYWRIVTRDREGNTSTSKVYKFST